MLQLIVLGLRVVAVGILFRQMVLEWSCECPDFRYRHVIFKHIYAVKFSQTLRQKVMSENLGLKEIDEPDVICKRCGSTNVIK